MVQTVHVPEWGLLGPYLVLLLHILLVSSSGAAPAVMINGLQCPNITFDVPPGSDLAVVTQVHGADVTYRLAPSSGAPYYATSDINVGPGTTCYIGVDPSGRQVPVQISSTSSNAVSGFVGSGRTLGLQGLSCTGQGPQSTLVTNVAYLAAEDVSVQNFTNSAIRASDGGTIAVKNAVFSKNTAPFDGGAISASGGGGGGAVTVLLDKVSCQSAVHRLVFICEGHSSLKSGCSALGSLHGAQ